jgi:hypothetical protein
MLVGFVDDYQIDVGALAPGQRLSRANLDRLLGIRERMGALQDAHDSDAFRREGTDALVDQGEARHAERDTLALAERTGDDMRTHEGFSEARGGPQYRALVARRKRAAQLGDGALLVRAQRP